MTLSKNLFSPKDINTLIKEVAENKLEEQLASDSVSDACASYRGPAGKFIRELEILLEKENTHIDFMTGGNLSLHKLIEFLLQRYGRCEQLYISTWAIKEVAARSIYSLHEKGLIGELFGVFDYRIKTVDSKSFNLVEPLFKKYELTKNHSKLLLLNFDSLKITILTSANLSNNPRIEAGYISLERNRYYFHVNWMTDVLNGIKVY